MLQVARLAPRLLGESASLVVDYLRSRQNPDGGFADRAGRSDLYYSVFALDGLLALRAETPAESTARFLESFDPAQLDLVHVSCLARCWAALPAEYRARAPRERILQRAQAYRSEDGAYHVRKGMRHGSLYGCFLGLGAHQDLGVEFSNPAALLECAGRLRCDDGGYANDEDLPLGLTPPTAAAATLMHHLGAAVPADVSQWLLARYRPDGGFYATSDAPIPDLLSTATALHALSALQVDLSPIRESCLDFIDSLWTNTGAFFGNWTEEMADSEYTFYALLALGHLSL